MRLATPVGNARDADGDSSRLVDGNRGLLGAAPGGNHILDKQNLLSLFELKTPTKGHHALDPLSETCPHTEPSARFVADDQAAESRRHDEVGSGVSCRPPLRRERAPELLRDDRMLKGNRALQVALRMQPRGESEVALEECSGSAHEIEDLVLCHVSLRQTILPLYMVAAGQPRSSMPSNGLFWLLLSDAEMSIEA